MKILSICALLMNSTIERPGSISHMMVTLGTKLGHSPKAAVLVKMKLSHSVYFCGIKAPRYFTMHLKNKDGLGTSW